MWSTAGSYKQAGIPNIKGSYGASLFDSNNTNSGYWIGNNFACDGAFKEPYTTITAATNNGPCEFEKPSGFKFNANNGATISGIYSDTCKTVQPNSLFCQYLIKY